MALFDKIKTQVGEVATLAGQAGQAGKAKVEEVQARRQLDALYRDLGQAVYEAQRDNLVDSSEISRLLAAITEHVAKSGISSSGPAEAPAGS
jgi:hypothetical protein